MSDGPVSDLAAKAKKAILDGRGGEARALIDQMEASHKEILIEQREREIKAVDFWLDRHSDFINALLGVEKGIPLFSPDDEIKLASTFRRLARFGTRGRTLVEVTELPEDFDPFAEEREALKAQINDLQSGMWINCVYCGHRYGPGDSTPATLPEAKGTPSMAEALTAHIAECPKHPLREARGWLKAVVEDEDSECSCQAPNEEPPQCIRCCVERYLNPQGRRE